MIKKRVLRVKGNRPCRGTVDLSGSSESAVLLITKSLLADVDAEIDNIPRSEYVLKYIELLEKIDIEVKWINTEKIYVSKPKSIKSDITFIKDEKDYEYGLILIPVLINRCQSCKTSLLYNKIISQYKDLNVRVEKENNCINFSIPLDFKTPHKHLDLTNEDEMITASRILQNYFYKNLTLIYDEGNINYAILNQAIWDKENHLVVNLYNQEEFNLFAILPVISDGEILVRNYNLTESLGFLLNICTLGGAYEVIGNDLKIWRTKFDEKPEYDFTKQSASEVGLLLLLLSTRISRPVKVEINNSEKILSVIKDLNIMGCKIEFPVDPSAIWGTIVVKPSLITTVKMTITSKDHASSMIAASVISSGNSRIEGMELPASTIPYLRDNLYGLGLNLEIK